MLASFGHSGRYYSRSALLGAAALILTVAPARSQETNFFDSIADFFNPNRAAGREAPAIDAVPYTVTIEVKGGDSSVKGAVADASNLESLKDLAPSGAAGLIRRALSDYERITAALYSQG